MSDDAIMLPDEENSLFRSDVSREELEETTKESTTAPVRFAKAFETKVLPDLDTLMQQLAPNEHAILVQGTEVDRTLEIMTGKKLGVIKQQMIQDLVVDKMPKNIMENTKLEFRFTVGEIQRLAWRRG